MPEPTTPSSSCPECGAALSPGQTQCDLCGFRTDAPDQPEEPAPRTAAPGPFCNQCGWRNPPGARFCSQCGAPLQENARPGAGPSAPATPAAPARATTDPMLGKRLGIVIAAAVLLVVGLYVISALSRQSATPPTVNPPPPPGVTETDAELFTPLSSEQETTIAALESDLNAATGEDRRTRQREMVNLLIGYGRPDLAAQAQEDLARLEPTPETWTKAGDLYFQWMSLLEESGGNPQPVAGRVLAAYDEALALRPEDLDVRARLAWAAQYDTSQPMRAINETKAVLDRDSTHIGALQNYAIFLARIGRTDQAIVQMERLKRFAGDDSMLVRSADAFIEAMQARAAQTP